jgi:hypothetical protein
LSTFLFHLSKYNPDLNRCKIRLNFPKNEQKPTSTHLNHHQISIFTSRATFIHYFPFLLPKVFLFSIQPTLPKNPNKVSKKNSNLLTPSLSKSTQYKIKSHSDQLPYLNKNSKTIISIYYFTPNL